VTHDEGQIRQLIVRFANSFDLKAWDSVNDGDPTVHAGVPKT
jgi:hypothetical protein